MSTKICTVCKIEKEISDFNWRSISKGTKQAWCKECHRKDDKDRYYNGNRKQQCAKRNKEYRQNVMNYINDIKLKSGCQKCGYSKCAQALDFHHEDSKTKDMRIANMKGWSMERINLEIAKCIIICCRCHRELHYMPQSSNG